MASVCFKAFSFLQSQISRAGHEPFMDCLEIGEDETVHSLIKRMGLNPDSVEAAFVNGRTVPLSTGLRHGDRVALVPPGTPGPYRVLLGIRDSAENAME
ncbi:MAG: MoaD/ThiS family protein [Desulfonatronovibrionaceae bacterium]